MVPTMTLAEKIRTERVQFKAGSTSKVIEGQIKGYDTIDYVLNASKGQNANISLATENGSTYFNILAPGENEVAMYVGSINGNQYEGKLPESGDYKIRVYMMRNAARRDEVAKYRLEMIVTNDK
ncbi:DNA breaking-rejoining protein [Synechocystis salina]|uniref:DNA breaking-rejoining protein n=1 Tax=Synechocystis salina TaxID=945780 RepID=UPI00187E146F|nr:DNA breaking-rejoining protein [Synechocystis salina]